MISEFVKREEVSDSLAIYSRISSSASTQKFFNTLILELLFQWINVRYNDVLKHLSVVLTRLKA